MIGRLESYKSSLARWGLPTANPLCLDHPLIGIVAGLLLRLTLREGASLLSRSLLACHDTEEGDALLRLAHS